MKDRRSIDSKMVRSNPDPMAPIGSELEIATVAYEYLAVEGPRLVDIASYGAQGWELTSVIPQPADRAVFYFKRVKR